MSSVEKKSYIKEIGIGLPKIDSKGILNKTWNTKNINEKFRMIQCLQIPFRLEFLFEEEPEPKAVEIDGGFQLNKTQHRSPPTQWIFGLSVKFQGIWIE